jgi:hypothetical protein
VKGGAVIGALLMGVNDAPRSSDLLHDVPP